ncbi:MAG: hypothetical protein ACYC6G_18950 [Desulfobaccales bacterium]
MSQIENAKESITNTLAALEAETHEVVRGSIQLNNNLVAAKKKIWRQVLVIWAVGIILAISYFFVLTHQPLPINQTSKRQVTQQNAGTNSATDQSSQSSQLPLKVFHASIAISEQEELVNLLTKIREAQLKKDIHLFMEAYSPDFPEVGQKRDTTLTIWKKYTYLDSQFKLTDLHEETPTTILGKVIWNIKAQDQKNGSIRILTKTYQVTFSKGSGKWLIHNLKVADNIKSN